MEPSWFARVASYLVELEQVADKIDRALQSTRVEAGDYKVEDAKAHHGRLMESLGLLEAKIAEREELLKASDAPTTGVTLTDVLPASVIFGSATTSQGSCNGTGPIICDLGTLNSDTTATLTIVVSPTEVGTITNTVIVEANEIDFNMTDNTAIEETTIFVRIHLPLVFRNYD